MLQIDNEIIELEKVVIGTVLIGYHDCYFAIEKLRPEHFTQRENQILWRNILRLDSSNTEVDLLTVARSVSGGDEKEFPNGNVPYYTANCINRVAGTHNIVEHSCILIQDYLRREVWAMSNRLANSTAKHGEDIFEQIENFEKKLTGLTVGMESNPVLKLNEAIRQYFVAADEVLYGGKRSGVPTGLKSLDGHTSGWQPTDLIVLAGRPGMGKTSSAVCFAMAASKRDEPTAIFSLEMSTMQLVAKIISVESTIDSQKLTQKNLNKLELDTAKQYSALLKDLKLFIDDTPLIGITELSNKCRRLVKQEGVKLIIIDYLQLISSGLKNVNRDTEIGHITKRLKALAKELTVPIILLSQLSRDSEKRGGEKKPMLSDLRESGNIEQDADMVIFCYRPDYYGLESYEVGNRLFTGYEIRELYIYIIEKFRNGSCGEITAKWIPENAAIKDL